MNHSAASAPASPRRPIARLATLALAFVLATGSVALAATGYTRWLHAATKLAPPAIPAETTAGRPHPWQPPGCVFPGADTFAGR